MKNKVKTNIMLDPDVKQAAMNHLANRGMSLSSFINMMLATYVEEIEGGGAIIPDKPMKELTLEEVQRLMTFWLFKGL